jgi:DNA-binding transcriptional LysR family regulator
VVPVWRDEMMLVLPARHPLAEAESIDLADLADESWIAGCPRCRGHLLELTDARDFVPRIAYETDNFVAVVSMVTEGVGVALIPSLALGSIGRTDGVVVRPTVNHDHRTINLVGAAGSDRVPAIAVTASALLALDATEWSLAML